ncbi:MAG TPA: SAM-dependent chlorinase/fluorinase, partial [Actinomycetota bacterium]|nr:SAM-dependent chlorinase/fluorinase [Actinomycetota bacterium]
RERHAVAVQSERGPRLVGPDNGLLSMAWRALGGAARAVEITSAEVILQPLSATFHGRDVFAPAAAHLALGRPLEFLGPELDPAALVELDLPAPRIGSARVECVVQAVDRYGNLQLNLGRADLEAAGLADLEVIDVHAADWTIPVRLVKTFADLPLGDLGLLMDSTGAVALFLNQGSAADAFAVESGDEVILGRPGEVE